MARRIEDYALIGDCETAALIGRDGSIDWLCWPRFDSEACFAALLGTPENGRWLIAPAEPGMRVERRYRDGTLILETDFETSQGAVTLTDFMPARDDSSDLIRIVTGRAGEVRMRMELVFRFDYGRLIPWVERTEGGALRAIAGPRLCHSVHRRAAPGRRLQDGRGVHDPAGPDGFFHPCLSPIASAAPETYRSRYGPDRYGGGLASLDRPVLL